MATLTASPWSRYALILVNLQHDFWSDAVAATAPELPDGVAGLLAYARTEGLTVGRRPRPDGHPRDVMTRRPISAAAMGSERRP
ncbi:MAG: hypothetical protein WKF58_00110 [Ilumatobacteraceae bacterium]